MTSRVWCVFAVTADDAGARVAITRSGLWLNCGHQHASQLEAERCPWEPEDAPLVYAGEVHEVHPSYFQRFAQGKMPWAERPLRQSGKHRFREGAERHIDSNQVRMPWD